MFFSISTGKKRGTHSAKTEVPANKKLEILFQKTTFKNKKSGEPTGPPGCSQTNGRTQTGTAKRTRISQRMSQHIMPLKFA